jgi:hypothetical protein
MFACLTTQSPKSVGKKGYEHIGEPGSLLCCTLIFLLAETYTRPNLKPFYLPGADPGAQYGKASSFTGEGKNKNACKNTPALK